MHCIATFSTSIAGIERFTCRHNDSYRATKWVSWLLANWGPIPCGLRDKRKSVWGTIFTNAVQYRMKCLRLILQGMNVQSTFFNGDATAQRTLCIHDSPFSQTAHKQGQWIDSRCAARKENVWKKTSLPKKSCSLNRYHRRSAISIHKTRVFRLTYAEGTAPFLKESYPAPTFKIRCTQEWPIAEPKHAGAAISLLLLPILNDLKNASRSFMNTACFEE